MLNSVGLQGPGVEAWAEHELPALRAGGVPVIVSLWGRSVDDFEEAARLLAPYVDACAAIELNVSCPNLEDASRMFAHSAGRDRLGRRRGARGRPRAAPVRQALAEHVRGGRRRAAAVDAGADGLTLVNTLLGLGIDAEGRRPLLGNVTGGYSGPPIKPVALRVVYEVTRALPGVPVIGTGGVSTGADAVEMLLAGASAVGVGTINFLEPRAVNRIHDELAAWCAERNVPRVADLVGALETEGELGT